jgi:hypothetical protein
MTLDKDIKRMQDAVNEKFCSQNPYILEDERRVKLMVGIATIAIILFVLFGVACLKAFSQVPIANPTQAQILAASGRAPLPPICFPIGTNTDTGCVLFSNRNTLKVVWECPGPPSRTTNITLRLDSDRDCFGRDPSPLRRFRVIAATNLVPLAQWYTEARFQGTNQITLPMDRQFEMLAIVGDP